MDTETRNPAGSPKITDTTPPAPSTPPAAGAPEEFARFESLTQKLVQVPKGELDEKRSQS